MSKKLLAVVVGVTFCALNLFAAGDAGCGLGSVVISKNSKGLQLIALTTNVSISSQPLGITSGTSNCSSSGIVSNDKEIEYYVEVNKSELLKDMAKGDGESLDTFASLYGCQTASSKKDFKEVYDKLNFAKGPSLGTEFTLLMPYTYLAHYDLIVSKEGKEFLEKINLPINLLRISVGVENIDEIINEFEKVNAV